MAGGASSSSSSPPFIFTYDAFLSFRGEDTRFGFTSNLYYALDHRGIYTFIDDRELGRGKEITPSLLTAIEESRIAIIVLSKKYASSSFCLDELAKIMECVKGKGRLVIPVFYDVDPSDVRKQTGTYGKALVVHENKFMANTENFNDNMERLRRWRMALKQVADLSGYHFKSGDGKYEFKFIAKIIEQVSIEIRHIALPVADHPVGLDSQVQNVISLLDVGCNNGVRVVGIHGIGGIGKTTLAVAVYNWVANRFADLSFEGLCFLENIREKSKKHGLEPLQMILLSELVGEQKIKLTSVGQGIAMLKHRLQRKKVLFVLDDVNQQQQLNALFGNHDWLESGSRVIITTRDMQLLSNYEDKITYELEKLNREDGLELLNWKAFKTNNVNQSYMDVLNDVVTYASGLPLALEVIGSHLLKKNLEEWKSALDQYKRSPHEEILTILKVSYDGLHELEKEIFLDITCFFGGCQLIDVKKILCAHHGVVSLDYGIGVLVEKSLIKIDRFDQVTSHNLIQEMGREIVCQESPKSPGERSRLWHLEDIVQIFGKNMGTDKIEIIYMDFPKSEKVIKWDGESFVKMRNLKALIIHKAHFSQGAKHLPSSLRVLRWCRYPSYSLPSDFYPEELVILELSQTCLISIGFLDKRQFMSLTVIKLDESNIEEIPDISGAPNLEELSFISCQNLIKVHKSVGFLDKLKILCASYCRKLSSLPPIRSTSLGELHLIGCLSLENFPEILGEMKDIEFIDGSETSIKELPSSIENLTMLEQLVFENCEMLLSIPSSIVKLSRLQIMEIRGSEGLRFVKQHEGEDQGSSMAFSNAADVAFLDCNISDESIPIVFAWFRNVVDLDLAGNNFTVLPKSIEELCYLSNLTLDNCKKLREIRGIPPNIKYFSAANCICLTALSISMLLDEELHKDGDKLFHWPGGLIRYGNKMIHFAGSSMPKGFYHSSRQDSISFWFRNRRPAISLCVVAVCEAEWMVARFPYELMINGNKVSSGEVYLDCCVEKVGAQYHTTIFDLLIGEDIAIVRSAINWYLAEIRFVSQYEEKGHGIKQIGMRVLKHGSSMDDISFTIPRCIRGSDADLWTYGMKLPLRPCWQEHLYSENLKSNLMEPASTSDAIRDEDQGCGIAARKRKRSTLMLDLNNEPDDTASEGGLLRYQSCELRLGGLHYEAIELPCYASPKMDSDSDSIMSSLASDTARKGGKQSGGICFLLML